MTERELIERSWATAVRITDLTGDGIPEVITQGPSTDCRPTGNCPFRVFAKTLTGYAPILRCIAQTFSLEGRAGSKSLDIVVGMHGSATERTFWVYRLSGGTYREIDCWDAVWPEKEDGTTAKEPVMKRCTAR